MAVKQASIVDQILAAAPTLHGAGTFSNVALQALYRHASRQPLIYSAETGAGASTLLFSNLSRHHTVFALDLFSSVTSVRASPLLRSEVVTFVEGPTQKTLPAHIFRHKLQLALIDGPHGYPFPDLEYYYLYPHLEEGALLIVDDIHIRNITNLYDFLRFDDMFHLEEVVQTTAFFRRTAAPTFSPVGDGYSEQGYNRRDFDPLPARPGESSALQQVETPTRWYFDEIGNVQNPLLAVSIQVRAWQSLHVAGWAIDELNHEPAAWVELLLDRRPYRTDTRVPRGDVAAGLGSLDFLRSGFRVTLPAEALTPGRHTIALRVILKGGRSYYEGPEIPFVAE